MLDNDHIDLSENNTKYNDTGLSVDEYQALAGQLVYDYNIETGMFYGHYRVYTRAGGE